MSTNSAKQTRYDKQVRRIAEILAKQEYDSIFYHCVKWDDLDKDDGTEFIGDYCKQEKESHIRCKMDAAKLIVAELKTAHYKGYITGLAAMEQFPEDTEANIDKRTEYYAAAAKRLGLTTSPTKTGE